MPTPSDLNPAAYPSTHDHDRKGMTFLDAIAIAAMQGDIAFRGLRDGGSLRDRADTYYEMADAMLSVRKKHIR